MPRVYRPPAPVAPLSQSQAAWESVAPPPRGSDTVSAQVGGSSNSSSSNSSSSGDNSIDEFDFPGMPAYLTTIATYKRQRLNDGSAAAAPSADELLSEMHESNYSRIYRHHEQQSAANQQQQQQPPKSKRTNARITDLQRQTVIDYYNNNLLSFSATTAAELFHIKRTTINNIIDVYKREQRTVAHPRGGRRESLVRYNSPIRDMVVQQQLANSAATLGMVQQKVEEHTSVTVPIATVQRILADADFTTKVLRSVVVQRNTYEQRVERSDYCLRAESWAEEDIAFVDEKPFCITYRRSLGRSPKGKRACSITPVLSLSWH